MRYNIGSRSLTLGITDTIKSNKYIKPEQGSTDPEALCLSKCTQRYLKIGSVANSRFPQKAAASLPAATGGSAPFQAAAWVSISQPQGAVAAGAPARPRPLARCLPPPRAAGVVPGGTAAGEPGRGCFRARTGGPLLRPVRSGSWPGRERGGHHAPTELGRGDRQAGRGERGRDAHAPCEGSGRAQPPAAARSAPSRPRRNAESRGWPRGRAARCGASTRFTARIHSRRCTASTGNLQQTEREATVGGTGGPAARREVRGAAPGRPRSLAEGGAALPAPPVVPAGAANWLPPPALSASSVPLAREPQRLSPPVGSCCPIGRGRAAPAPCDVRGSPGSGTRGNPRQQQQPMTSGDAHSQWEQRFPPLYTARGEKPPPFLPAGGRCARQVPGSAAAARRAQLRGAGSRSRARHSACRASGRGTRRREAAAELRSGCRERWVRGRARQRPQPRAASPGRESWRVANALRGGRRAPPPPRR